MTVPYRDHIAAHIRRYRAIAHQAQLDGCVQKVGAEPLTSGETARVRDWVRSGLSETDARRLVLRARRRSVQPRSPGRCTVEGGLR